MISDTAHPLTRQRLRSPRAAAFAGFAFSLLLGTTMLLIQLSIPDDPIDNGAWMQSYTQRVSLAMGLVPFAGIAFLWFMGVIREQVGALEGQFFSSVFFGSGVLFLGALFVWMATVVAILTAFAGIPEGQLLDGGYLFARTFMDALGGVVMLRMAGVFMFSSGTIWLRTVIMPRWVVWLTFLMALGLLIGAGQVRILRLGFPVWVFIVSIFLLRFSLQRGDEDEPIA